MLRSLSRFMQRNPLIAGLLGRIGVHGGAGVVDADHYRGETARNYLEKRLKQAMWHEEQKVMARLIESFDSGIRVLDVAFGTGRFVELYLNKEMDVHGIDISPDMVEAAREALGPMFERCRVEIGSADTLPYEDDEFDLVVCFRFFGLIPFAMARDVLAEIHRVCHGEAIIRVPIRKNSAGALPPPSDDDLVQGRLLDRELELFFARHGFNVSERAQVGEREKERFVVYRLTRVEGCSKGGQNRFVAT